MACYRIHGGRPLNGEVRVGGRKNSAVAVLPAALLADTPSTIRNLPQIRDVATHARILGALGARVRRPAADALVVDPRPMHEPQRVSAALARRMRASYYLLGVLLGRFGEAVVPLPGGCRIGSRPIDQHLKGLRALGAQLTVRDGAVHARAPGPLQGAPVYLDVSSVGATINIMLAAVLAEGVTVIENAAREQHVVDVAHYLRAMGAHIGGAGTETIIISGVPSLHGSEYTIIPDDIEAATYMMAVAATRGSARICSVVPAHLEAVSTKLRQAGVAIRDDGDAVEVSVPQRLRAIDVTTQTYPGFPTDAQQPLTALLATADGTSTITETVWDGRFTHVAGLRRLGAELDVDGDRCVIDGVPELRPAMVEATDLRAGAALIVAELAADGETMIQEIEHVERGYERMVMKLRGLGASIERLEADTPRGSGRENGTVNGFPESSSELIRMSGVDGS